MSLLVVSGFISYWFGINVLMTSGSSYLGDFERFGTSFTDQS